MYKPTKKQIEFMNRTGRDVLYGVSRTMKEAEVIPLDTLPKRIKGKIVKLDKEGGWGFIISNEMRFKRFYFHWSALPATVDFTELEVGERVEFDPINYTDPRTNEEKGWRAFRITILENE